MNFIFGFAFAIALIWAVIGFPLGIVYSILYSISKDEVKKKKYLKLMIISLCGLLAIIVLQKIFFIFNVILVMMGFPLINIELPKIK